MEAAKNMSQSVRRRTPSQERSRERYETILRVARDLIGERGNDAVSMREIARQAGAPISAIYQYFPDKNAILAAIMEAYFDRIRSMVIELVESCDSFESLLEKSFRGLGSLYRIFREDPALATLWAGLQANPELQELDAEDSRRNAKIIAEKVLALSPKAHPVEVHDSMYLLSHMMGMAIRVSLTLEEPEGERLFNEFKRIVMLRLQAFAHLEHPSQ
jgi:AcrR family transcriptional regulator